MDNNKVYIFRLNPGEDLRKSIEAFVKEKNIIAGWINTCVGSLTDYTIRFANQQEGNNGSGHFEIVSLTGTVSVNGSHLHISISDSTGKTIVLRTFSDLMEAKAMQNKLEEHGITSSLTDENVLGLDPVGGIELKIFEKDKEAALKLIDQ